MPGCSSTGIKPIILSRTGRPAEGRKLASRPGQRNRDGRRLEKANRHRPHRFCGRPRSHTAQPGLSGRSTAGAGHWRIRALRGRHTVAGPQAKRKPDKLSGINEQEKAGLFTIVNNGHVTPGQAQANPRPAAHKSGRSAPEPNAARADVNQKPDKMSGIGGRPVGRAGETGRRGSHHDYPSWTATGRPTPCKTGCNQLTMIEVPARCYALPLCPTRSSYARPGAQRAPRRPMRVPSTSLLPRTTPTAQSACPALSIVAWPRIGDRGPYALTEALSPTGGPPASASRGSGEERTWPRISRLNGADGSGGA